MKRQKTTFLKLLFTLLIFCFQINFLWASSEQKKVIDLSSEKHNFCALLEDGESICWGKGNSPRKPPKEAGAKKIVPGVGCYLTKDDTLSCWKLNKRHFPTRKKAKFVSEGDGVLCMISDSDTVECYPEKFNEKTGLKAKSVSVGIGFYCAILLDDTVYCWGTDKYAWVNKLGNTWDGRMKAISSFYTTCAIDFENNLNCWSDGFEPVQHPKIKVKQVAVTHYHACVIKIDDTVTCWGDNDYGQTDVPTGLKAQKVAVNKYGSCALAMENRVICWGQKNRSQTDMPKGLKVKKLRSSFADMCAIDQKDTLHCWGRTFSSGIKQIANVKDVAMHFDHYCAIKMNDTVECWGGFYYRESSEMESIKAYLQKLKVKNVFPVGVFHDCVHTVDDEIICWRSPDEPQQPEYPSGYRFKSVSFSDTYNCGITFQDQPICWLSERISDSKDLFDIPQSIPVPRPDRTEEDLSDNTGTFKKVYDFFKEKLSSEKPLPKIINWSTVSPENIHASSMKVKKVLVFRYGACVIKMDDRVVCWGNDQAGETKPPKEKKFKDLFLLLKSNTRVCGKDFKNDVICWGDEDREQEHILPYVKAVSIWAQNDGGCVIDIEDELNCWGRHDTGLWDEPRNSKGQPIKVKQLATTQWSACAVKMDDSLVCWGHLHWMKPIMEVVPEEIKGRLPQ